ncbi:MAG: hypothetical protein Q9184_003007 [Pyrenodesmia sp. 2 TL-2023]
MSISAGKSGIIPANLAFLTIYNPSLSQNDDTIEDQILYYYSQSETQKTDRRPGRSQYEDRREYKNKKLRQIGLAQGMVEFAKCSSRTFSDGQAVDSIETEKSRILLRQVEAGWWLLASVDLTRISSPPDPQANPPTSHDKTESNTEYSSREVSPPSLLLKQIVQAHQVFLLHHAQTLQELFLRLPRTKFCAILKRFWDDFVRNWDVLLHGNPAVDVFDGVKLAAGGELGIGVGEEEWGSGEREVLEGFIERTDGLVDLIVSRFGEMTDSTLPDDNWHLGRDPRPSDGVIFSGIGAIGRPSVKRISDWVILLFKHGPDAYGVRENPVAVNRRQRKKTGSEKVEAGSIQAVTGNEQRPSPIVSSRTTTAHSCDFGIPAPIVGAPTNAHLQQPKNSRESPAQIAAKTERTQPAAAKEYAFGSDTLMKYMTFGLYGSKSATPSTDVSGEPSNAVGKDGKKGKGEHGPSRPTARSSNPSTAQGVSPGYFMVGLQGDLDDEDVLDSAPEREDTLRTDPMSSRIVLRTLVVERTGKGDTGAMKSPSTNSGSSLGMLHDRLRVIVYVKRPFIFTFLFDLHTDSLAIPSFYRSLHHQLGPLQQPLLSSTSPTKVSERLSEALAPRSTVTTRSSQLIHDLVYDPYNLTVHTTIPNIPEPGASPNIPTAGQAAWTRVEALSVHSQILNTYISTRRRASELERTCKTNRGWWVVWMRIPHVAASQQLNQMVYREAFLIRKASDYVPTAKVLGGSWGKGAGASSGWGPGKLAEGIGIDARQYIEGLVSLNR